MVCSKCADSIKNSYLFLKNCEYSNKTWNDCLDTIKNSIDLTNDVNYNIQTVYIMMKDKILFTSKRTVDKCKKTLLTKVNSLVRSRKTYERTKNQSNIICEQCGVTLPSNYHLVKHMRSHRNQRYPCPQCHKVFASQMQVKGHIERIHQPKRVMCSKCSKMFSTQKMLKCHDRVHHVAAICKVCFVQFPSRNSLRLHMDKHDVNKCPRCDKSFLNKQTFRLHLKICDDKEKIPQFFCDLCSKGYVRKNGLRSHLKTDHGFGEVLHCNWCNKKFDAKSKLKLHIVKHTKEKNFHCEQCGNKFVTQASLRYHVRLHTGEKPFHCKICGENFLSASRRVEHMKRKHIGPTKECTVCHNKYVTSHQLKQHMSRHNNPQSRLYVKENGCLSIDINYSFVK